MCNQTIFSCGIHRAMNRVPQTFFDFRPCLLKVAGASQRDAKMVQRGRFNSFIVENISDLQSPPEMLDGFMIFRASRIHQTERYYCLAFNQFVFRLCKISKWTIQIINSLLVFLEELDERNFGYAYFPFIDDFAPNSKTFDK